MHVKRNENKRKINKKNINKRKTIKNILLCTALPAVWAMIAAGCGGPGKEDQSSQRSRLFGATYMSRTNPFFDVLHESIQEVVEGNGDTIISRDPAQDQEKQNEQIQDMIDEGIELLFLNPVDLEAVKPALIACREAGIPVINVDTRVKDREYVVSMVETDNYQAGAQCARDMMKQTENARILILTCPKQASVTDRVDGFLDTISGHEEYQVVHQMTGYGEMDEGAQATAEVLDHSMDFDVIFGGNDPMALGALSVLLQRNIEDKILIYGVDGSPDSKAMINQGYVTGSSAQSAKTIGRTAGELAYQYLETGQAEEHISIAPILITKENIDDFNIDGWQ